MKVMVTTSSREKYQVKWLSEQRDPGLHVTAVEVQGERDWPLLVAGQTPTL